MPCRLGLLFFIFSASLNCFAQQNENEKLAGFYATEVKRIAIKLYDAGFNNKLAVYANDSLQAPLTSKEIKEKGSHTEWISNDSALKFPFNSDSLLGDFIISYQLGKTDNTITVNPEAMAIAAPVTLGIQNLFVVPVPIYWFDMHDLSAALTASEIEFISHYAEFKLIDANQGNAEINWRSEWEKGIPGYFSRSRMHRDFSNAAFLLGDYILKNILRETAKAMVYRKVKIQNKKNIEIPNDTFVLAHTRSPCIMSPFMYPQDSMRMEDSLFNESLKPRFADSFFVDKHTGKIRLGLYFSNNNSPNYYYINAYEFSALLPTEIKYYFNYFLSFYKE